MPALHFNPNEAAANKDEFELIEPGRYDCTLVTEWRETRGGDAYINCAFRIDKDRNQKFGGRIVFDGIYKSKTTGDYQASKINALLATIPNPKTDFEDYDELLLYLNGIKVNVEIDIEPADPERPMSKDKNIITYLSYQPVEDNNSSTSGINIPNDADIPF